MNLELEDDQVIWALEKHGSFRTKSLYKQICCGGVINRRMQEVWESKLPLKVKIFLWQMYHDKLQSAVQLKRRK